jgi:hypothetical protein
METKMYRVIGGYQQEQKYSIMVEAKSENEANEKASKIHLSEWDDLQSQDYDDFVIFETEED